MQSSHFGRTADRNGGANTARGVEKQQAHGLSPSCAGSTDLERRAERGGYQPIHRT